MGCLILLYCYIICNFTLISGVNTQICPTFLSYGHFRVSWYTQTHPLASLQPWWKLVNRISRKLSIGIDYLLKPSIVCDRQQNILHKFNSIKNSLVFFIFVLLHCYRDTLCIIQHYLLTFIVWDYNCLLILAEYNQVFAYTCI